MNVFYGGVERERNTTSLLTNITIIHTIIHGLPKYQLLFKVLLPVRVHVTLARIILTW